MSARATVAESALEEERRGFAELQVTLVSAHNDHLGELRTARETLIAALDYRPRHWPAHLNLGIVEREMGHHLRAIEWFEEALTNQMGSNPEAEVNYRLGELYVSLGNREKAIAHFDAAYAGSPYGSWGKQSKSYLEILR